MTKVIFLRNVHTLMSPIVIFAITFNCLLCILCLWAAGQIVQWRRSLIRLNQSLVQAERSLQTGLIPIENASLSKLQTHYQRLDQSLKLQLIPAIQLLTSLYDVQRHWSRINRFNLARGGDRQKPMSRRIR